MDSTSQRLRVVYIIGAGRSGSTLLGNVLGQMPGVFHTGELLRVWKYGVALDTPCGCGATIRTCSVWSRVIDEVAPGALRDAARARDLAALQRSATRTRNAIPISLRSEVRNPLLLEYADLMERVYVAIARTAGAACIVDSSKRPTPAVLMDLMPNIEPFFIHLVRDPRAEAFSWTRERPSIGEPGDALPRVGAVRAASSWLAFNALAELVSRGRPSVFVRYEELCESPLASIRGVVNATGLDASSLPFVDETSVELVASHAIGGNPAKWQVGRVSIRLDDEWMRRQRRRDRVVVGAISAPLMRKYGYSIGVHERREPGAVDIAERGTGGGTSPRSRSDGSPRSVLFTSLHSSIGGSDRSLATILRHLPRRMCRVVAAPPGPFADLVRKDRLAEEQVSLPLPPRHQRLLRLRQSARLAVWIIAHRRSLVAIHANGLADLGVVWLGAWLAKVPVVVWSHKSGTIANRTHRGAFLARAILKRRLHWAAVSPVARDTLVNGRLANRGDVAVIGNPIDCVDVVSSTATERDISIGFLGNASFRKGFQFLPDIAERVQGPRVRWLIFATPRASGELEDVWRTVKQIPGVEVVGRESDVRRAYARCDVVLCPSLLESFCRVAGEAMANGIPVVGTDLPALRDLVGHGRCGLLFPPGDADAAADAIRRLIRDPELRVRLGARGRLEARSYDPAAIAARFAELYAGVRAAVAG